MKKMTTRKIIGTLAVALVVSLGVFGTAKASQAFFLGAGNSLVFDGVVGSVTPTSAIIYTTGTNPITVQINRRTSISQGGLTVGDNVKVVARNTGGQIQAQVIQRSGGASGYGTAGDPVLVTRGQVRAKTATTFTVRVNGADVIFHVNASTRFFGGPFSSLHVGENVVAFGQDTGNSSTGFVAQTVFH